MAKLYFNYGAMNSGKSQNLINTVYNYRNQDKKCLVYTTINDTRSKKGMVQSRTGSSVSAKYVTDNIFNEVSKELRSSKNPIFAIVVDEAEFLTNYQVKEITRIVDDLDIPVICFGLKSDFQGHMFEGSKTLFELSDKLTEVKTICFCCSINKATFNLRINENGEPVSIGDSIQPGNNYMPVCRKCYKKMLPNWEENI